MFSFGTLRALRPPARTRRPVRYTKSELTLSSLWMRRIASPSSSATETTSSFGHSAASGPQRDRVGHDELAQRRLDDALDRRAREHRVRHHREHLAGARVRERARRLGERARRVDHVVDDDAGAALHLADDVHHLASLARSRRLSMIASDRAEALRVGRARSTPPASGEMTVTSPDEALAHGAQQHRHREEVVERDVEEALDLPGVEVDAEQAVGARHRDRGRRRASR